jgi:hypothetical protein
MTPVTKVSSIKGEETSRLHSRTRGIAGIIKQPIIPEIHQNYSSSPILRIRIRRPISIIESTSRIIENLL